MKLQCLFPKYPKYAYLLFKPNIILCNSLHPLKLRAHIRTCRSRCQGLRKRPWFVWVGDDSFGNCIGALAFPVDFELD